MLKGGARRWLLSALIAAMALLGGVFMAAAQSVDDESQAVVLAALADFRLLASYRFSGETSLRQEIFVNDNAAIIQTDQSLEGQRSGMGMLVQLTVEQTISGSAEPTNWTAQVERITLGDAVWLRFSDLIVPPAVGSSVFELPQGWFVPEGLPEDLSQLSPTELGLASFIDGYARAVVIPPLLDYPLDTRTIVSFEQLADAVIDGETLRVYEATFNAFGLYIAHTQQDWDSTLFNFEASGLDIARFFVEGGLQVSGRYWIDSAGQIAQVEQLIRVELNPEQFSTAYTYRVITETRARMRFSDFDVPLEISAPDV